MAFRRITSLPCKISKKISLRLHPDTYQILKEEAEKLTLENGRLITIGDLIRKELKESILINSRVPLGTSHLNADSHLDQVYHQQLMSFA